MRSQSGNMLILSSVFMALVAILVLLASSFGALWFEHSRLQQSANEIALAGARKLNENDRLGQMNNMVARCRQLYYSSADDLSQVDASYEHLHHLAEQLANEARDSAYLIDSEQQALATLARNEAQTAMNAKYDEIKVSYPMSLPWLRVDAPTMPISRNGKLRDVESNVFEMRGFSELVTHDNSQSYLRSYPDGIKLYKEHTNARLPGGASHLNFRISSLAAPVTDVAGVSLVSNRTTIAPARAVLASKFRTIDSSEFPSACQVTLKLKVTTGLGAAGSSYEEAVGTATATGGGLPL
jgi:hypothetical protein